MTTTEVRMRAFSGSPSLGCTRAKNLEAGRPPSLEKLAVFLFRRSRREAYRANAKIMRLLVVMTLNVAKIRHTNGSLYHTVSLLSTYNTKGHGLYGAGKYEHEKADGTCSVARGVDKDL